MRSTDFASIPSPIMLGGIGRAQPMARGGAAKAPHHHVVIVSPSPVLGALMAALMMRQAAAARPKRGALHEMLAKKKR